MYGSPFSRLVAIALRRGLDVEEAQDVASEAILRAGSAPDLDLERADAWMSVVVQRLSVDVHRRRPTQAQLARVHHHEVPDLDEASAVDDREEAAWVATVVAGLPDAQRDVLHLVAAGAGPAAVAQSTGRSYKSVESCLSRARSHVRHALEATLAVGGALAAGLRPRLRFAAPALTVAAFLGVAVQLGGPPAGAAATVVRGPETAAGTTGQPAGVPHSAARARARAVHTSRPALPVAALPPQAVGPLRHSRIAVERQRGEESFVGSALWCLREGLTISPERVGCPEPDDALSP